MNNIPPRLRKWIDLNPEFKHCRRGGSDCAGRITVEHALYYQGRQIQEWWAIIPLCEYHHLRRGLNKELNRYLALKQAPQSGLKKYPKHDWEQDLKYLKSKYERKSNSESVPRPIANETDIPLSE